MQRVKIYAGRCFILLLLITVAGIVCWHQFAIKDNAESDQKASKFHSDMDTDGTDRE